MTEDEKKRKRKEISPELSREADEFFQDEESICNACGGPLKKDMVNLEDFEGGKVYLIEKVPALICEECGEVWVPEESMQEFEEMIETVKQSRKEKAAASEKRITRPKRSVKPLRRKKKI